MALGRQHELMNNWDLSDSKIATIAEGVDTAIGTVLHAVTGAINNITLWTGGKLDARLNLLTELETFQLGLQQSIVEITQSILNGTITTQYRRLLSQLIFFLQTHLHNINNLITILIPTMEDLTATRAITSCLHAVQVIQAAIEKLSALLSL
jgi:hypothetical protein